MLENEAANQELYERIYSDPAFSKAILNFYLVRMHRLLRQDGAGDSGEIEA